MMSAQQVEAKQRTADEGCRRVDRLAHHYLPINSTDVQRLIGDTPRAQCEARETRRARRRRRLQAERRAQQLSTVRSSSSS